MSACNHCGKFILFGGRRVEDRVYCGAGCAAHDQELTLSRQIPAEQVREQMQRLRLAPCPRCKGPGPVDVHASHKVHSFLVMTQWSRPQVIGCRRCGLRRQFGHLFYSAVLGWWGFPWGLVMTPVQVVRNIGGIVRARGAHASSPEFEQVVRRLMA